MRIYNTMTKEKSTDINICLAEVLNVREDLRGPQRTF